METPDNISLILRLALIESLTLGGSQQRTESVSTTATPVTLLPQSKETLLLRSQNAQLQFLQSIERHKPIVQFVNEYKENQAYLQPAGLVSEDDKRENGGDVEQSRTLDGGEGVPLLSTQSIISLLLESEADIRQLSRDLRRCSDFHERGIAGAGKLADHMALLPRLDRLASETDAASKQRMMTEERAMQLMEQYSAQVDVISNLFIQWDQILTQTEGVLTQLERSTW
ncbi:hypothetical protein CBS101457_001443 [Exobasidium rhododendri]|nr:hypothetical protein CBS101457_001443 [Exobasidium rhododendri]